MLFSSSSTLASSEDALSLFSESPTTVTSHTDFSSSQNHATYTDADWAAESQQNYLKPLSRSAPSSRSPSPTRTPPKPKPLRLAHKKQLAPSLMMSMTAVLEMDDDDAAAVTHGGGKGYVRCVYPVSVRPYDLNFFLLDTPRRTVSSSPHRLGETLPVPMASCGLRRCWMVIRDIQT
jgi:hypothetical protein